MDFLTIFGIALSLIALGFFLGVLYYRPLISALEHDVESAKAFSHDWYAQAKRDAVREYAAATSGLKSAIDKL